MPLELTPTLSIPDEDLSWKFVRATGPGGQNVNKVSSAVQLRFDLAANATLPPSVKERLRRLAGRKLLDDGTLLIVARAERSQERNRGEALERLAAMIRAALVEPKPRKRTRPTRASKLRRLDDKKRRGDAKRTRGARGWD